MSKLTKFFKSPLLFFKDAKKKKTLKSDIENLSSPVIFFIHANGWKHAFLRKLLGSNSVVFIPMRTTEGAYEKFWLPIIKSQSDAKVIVWGYNVPKCFLQQNLDVTYVEDAFVRSVGLGANHVLPIGLNFDAKAPYFDARNETDIEGIYNSYPFDADLALRKRSEALIKKLIEHGITKYNHVPVLGESPYPASDKKRVLVIGQVDKDASIIYGSDKAVGNLELIELAGNECSGNNVYYKPHPEMYQNPEGVKALEKAKSLGMKLLEKEYSLPDMLLGVDHVYTITSQVGFEALIRGIKVTALGCPFYSGWGLTDDRQKNERRGKKLLIEDLVSGALILYPTYFNPNNGVQMAAEEAVDWIVRARHNFLYQGHCDPINTAFSKLVSTGSQND